MNIYLKPDEEIKITFMDMSPPKSVDHGILVRTAPGVGFVICPTTLETNVEFDT